MFAKFLILARADGAPTFGVARQEAVNHHIGIATNGRSEMGIIIKHQAVMAYVFNTVTGFGHRTQRHHLDHPLLFFAFHVFEQTVKALADVFLRTFGANFITKLGDKPAQRDQLLGIRDVVYTVGKDFRFLAARHSANVLGHGAVGQQHKLLDEFVCILGQSYKGRDGVPFVIDFKTYLRAVETYGPVFETFAPQLFSQSVERNKLGGVLAYGRRSFDHFGMLARRGQIFRTRLAVLLENVLHFFVNKATVGTDNGMG